MMTSAMLASMISQRVGGYLNSIVEQPQIGGIIYNKDVFDACGITETLRLGTSSDRLPDH